MTVPVLSLARSIFDGNFLHIQHIYFVPFMVASKTFITILHLGSLMRWLRDKKQECVLLCSAGTILVGR